LELGKHLVEELGHADRGTTLGRWMAHQLASLMRDAEDAPTEKARSAARKAAQNLIQELWEQRATLPGAADPMARYQRAITTLEVLSPNSLPWQRQSADALHANIAELHEAVSKLIYGVILLDVSSDLPRGEFEKLALPFLERTEQRLVYLLGKLSITIADPNEGEKADQPASIEERIAAAQQTLLAKASKALTKLQEQSTKRERNE
jgi:hypothetical protein